MTSLVSPILLHGFVVTVQYQGRVESTSTGVPTLGISMTAGLDIVMALRQGPSAGPPPGPTCDFAPRRVEEFK